MWFNFTHFILSFIHLKFMVHLLALGSILNLVTKVEGFQSEP